MPSEMFNCTQTEFIHRNQVCDGVRDCSNGADEMSCGSCNFRDNFDCGYNRWFNGMFDNIICKKNLINKLIILFLI